MLDTYVNKIQKMYGRSRVNVEVEPPSTFMFTHDLSYIVSFLFTQVHFTRVRESSYRAAVHQLFH